MTKRVHVIINPAAGQDRPILGILNTAFQNAGVDWEVFLTKAPGDGRRYAEQAVAAGVDAVAVYGGDGTIMEVASGLIGTNVPLGIFPGGTANVLSVDLGIPSDLAEACALVCREQCSYRPLDVGRMDDHYFLIRVGLGLEAEMVEGATRELKDRLGTLAYALAALQALREPKVARYTLTLDGETVTSEGLTCIIANSGSVGRTGLALAPRISVSDGLLDVVVLRQADLPALVAVAASIVSGSEPPEPLQHWQARAISVVVDPPQTVQLDGETLGLRAEVRARVLPGAVRVIVPA
jgi:YegS/Rv2252/BmrU family lipid kinase